MSEANLRFKREEREGIIPVGSYLSDAAARLGIRPDAKCVPFENIHFCRVTLLEGSNLLSPRTAHETEFLSAENGGPDERLGCQTKITEPGEIVIMTTETKAETPEAEVAETAKEYAKEFAELPLEKKISQLVHLEAIALGETVSFIFNSPFLIFEKAMDVMAGFGLKKEEQGKKAARPAEHVVDADEKAPDDEPESEKGEAEPPAHG
jgi:ferredoxin